ncbi:MAG: type IV toxin-antitoxin system AbiEi family antitoxin [Bacteroidales bacterium]|nr:type IV toxin-antitoxin system AbiEi family antitoxin [Bacteroidales bacterium]
MKDRYVYDAVNNFGQLSGIQNEVSIERLKDDYQLTIRQVDYRVAAWKEIRVSSKGIVLQQVKELEKRIDQPIIIISNYIALEVADELRQNGINYLDGSGNTYVRNAELLVFISGQKIYNPLLTKQARAFRESGIKLIFLLLCNPDIIHLPNRRLSELSGISVGSVSNILTELESLNFVLKAGGGRHLKNLRLLLDRWIISYFDVLRPRLAIKRMDFEFAGDYINWQDLPIQNSKGRVLWGGETAAALKTMNLNPKNFTLYTDQNWKEFARDLRLILNESGNLEILEIFWDESNMGTLPGVVPELLIYADLVGSGVERNIQIANEILANDLQYIK